jgi:hypothetical protein
MDSQLDDDFGRIVNKVKPSNRTGESKLSVSRCLHLLVALGVDAHFEDSHFSSGMDLLRLLTHSQEATEYFGHPVMLSTPYGVRPLNDSHFRRASEAHRDQLFCCFAQLGVAIDHPMTVQGKPCTFGDVFRDSIANFHLGQKELEFTAIAYALYFPPHRAWVNKFNEEYTFDHLAIELLGRDLNKTFCCGAHLVEALIVISRVDSECEPILSDTSRNRIRERLDLICKTIVQRQASDGSWGPQWYYDLLSANARHQTPYDTPLEGRLLATGHITQCLAHLPRKQYPLEDSVLRRAVAWLDRTTATLDEAFIRKHFCPCSHAAWCLDHFGRAAGTATLGSEPNGSASVSKSSVSSISSHGGGKQ